jgi:hypothetical protein
MGGREWRSRPVYGKQWRDWEGPDGPRGSTRSRADRPDQHNPASRRQIVSAWNPAEIDRMALAPCHCLFQTQVAAASSTSSSTSAAPTCSSASLQHRELRAADAHARRSMRARAGHVRLDRRRLPPLFEPSRPGALQLSREHGRCRS